MDVLLQDKIFISTRPRGKSEELKYILQNHGAELVELPMIEIQPEDLDSKNIDILTFPHNWIIFTSANGITHFFQHLKHLIGSFSVGNAKIAVIGKRTASELRNFGHEASYINSGKTSSDFIKELRVLFGNSNPQILLPFGNLAETAYENELHDCALIRRVNVYKTILPKTFNSEALQRIIEDNYDMIIFTSPSGFINLYDLTRNKLDINSIRSVCIGDTTKKALTEKGVNPLLTSNIMSSEGIAHSIVEYYQNLK